MINALNVMINLLQIPSPYSSQRLHLVKQLERTKKMEVESDVGRSSKENEEDKSLRVTMP